MLGARGIHYGKSWETILSFQARLQGLLLVSHGSRVKYISPNKSIAQKADVDFRLCRNDGRIVLFDAKSYAGAYFTFSQLTKHQLERCDLYARFGQTAGMLVLLRGCNAVVFFSIQNIRERTKGSRFTADSGLHLGNAAKFSFAPLFTLSC